VTVGYSAAPTLVEGTLGLGTSCPNGYTAEVNQLYLFEGDNCDGNWVLFSIDLIAYAGDFASINLNDMVMSNGDVVNFDNAVSSYI
jgi:hypothetical protein